MVEWQDGTLVSPAYVNEDGTIIPAVYEGNTPLSAYNLNKMQEDLMKEIEALKKIDEKLLDTSLIKPLVPTNNAVSNHTGYGNSYYYKIGTRVHVHLGLKIDTKESVNIFTLPAGYRPYSVINAIGFGSSGMTSCGATVNPNGTISVITQNGYGSVDLDFDAVS